MYGIAKATDENLTSENWEYILVCNSAITQYASRGRGGNDLTRGLGCYRMSVIKLLLRSQGMFSLWLCSLLNVMLTEDMTSSAKDAVAAMIKRLAHRNANVQLYTLEVCGSCASLRHVQLEGLVASC